MFNKEMLLEQSGIGPWGSYNRITDNIYNNQFLLNHQRVKLSLPDPSNPYLAERFFYRAYGLRISHRSQVYEYDFFSSFGALGADFADTLGDWFLEDLKRSVFIEQEIEADFPNFSLSTSLERIKYAALRGSSDSLDAITVLHNIARKQGRIAFVACHGTSCATYTEEGMQNELWRLVNGDSSVDINQIAQDISLMRDKSGNPVYSAIYFDACNPAGVVFEMKTRNGHVLIPVVAHTANNEALNGPARVYWPTI